MKKTIYSQRHNYLYMDDFKHEITRDKNAQHRSFNTRNAKESLPAYLPKLLCHVQQVSNHPDIYLCKIPPLYFPTCGKVGLVI